MYFDLHPVDHWMRIGLVRPLPSFSFPFTSFHYSFELLLSANPLILSTRQFTPGFLSATFTHLSIESHHFVHWIHHWSLFLDDTDLAERTHCERAFILTFLATFFPQLCQITRNSYHFTCCCPNFSLQNISIRCFAGNVHSWRSEYVPEWSRTIEERVYEDIQGMGLIRTCRNYFPAQPFCIHWRLYYLHILWKRKKIHIFVTLSADNGRVRNWVVMNFFQPAPCKKRIRSCTVKMFRSQAKVRKG